MVLKTLQYFTDRGEVVLVMVVLCIVFGLLYQGVNTLWEGKSKGFESKNQIVTNVN